MTKRLEELFNLEEKSAEPIKSEEKISHEEIDSVEKSYQAIAQVTKNLPQITELDSLEEKDLDDLAKKAEDAYDDLMDLGMNVEVRYSGRIFEVAASMMGNAITAKSAKIEKKLKAIDLQLKKYKIDKDAGDSGDDDIINGQGYIISDRNELLKKLGQKD